MYTDLKPCLENIKHHEDLWARATYVYDKYKGREGLEILDLPEMREDALLKIKLDETLDKLKHRKFSTPPPIIVKAQEQAQSQPSSRVSVSISPRRPSVAAMSRKSVTPVSSDLTRKSRPSMGSQEDEDLQDVDTGENRTCCSFCKRK